MRVVKDNSIGMSFLDSKVESPLQKLKYNTGSVIEEQISSGIFMYAR